MTEPDTDRQEYTVVVEYTSGEQGAMEAADRISKACSEIQEHPDVKSVKATIPGPNDFKQVRTDGGVDQPGKDRYDYDGDEVLRKRDDRHARRARDLAYEGLFGEARRQASKIEHYPRNDDLLDEIRDLKRSRARTDGGPEQTGTERPAAEEEGAFECPDCGTRFRGIQNVTMECPDCGIIGTPLPRSELDANLPTTDRFASEANGPNCTLHTGTDQ